MQYGTIGTEYKYDLNAATFQTAFAFLRRDDLKTLPVGWIDLENGVRASVQHYTTASPEELSFESHERFFDIQYLVEGKELLGVCTRKGLKEKVAYNETKDVTLYEDPDCYGQVLLMGGDYVVFSPEDVHKPKCQAGEPMPVIKIVVKVPV